MDIFAEALVQKNEGHKMVKCRFGNTAHVPKADSLSPTGCGYNYYKMKGMTYLDLNLRHHICLMLCSHQTQSELFSWHDYIENQHKCATRRRAMLMMQIDKSSMCFHHRAAEPCLDPNEQHHGI